MPTTMTIAGIPIKPIDCWDNRDDYYSRIRKPWGNYSLRRRMESCSESNLYLFIGGQLNGETIRVHTDAFRVITRQKDGRFGQETYFKKTINWFGIDRQSFVHESIADKPGGDILYDFMTKSMIFELDKFVAGLPKW